MSSPLRVVLELFLVQSGHICLYREIDLLDRRRRWMQDHSQPKSDIRSLRRYRTAAVELRPLHDVREGPVGQPPDRQEDIVRVDRNPQRHRQRRQARRRGRGRQEVGGLVVKLRGRPGGAGQPVDGRVGEQPVAGHRVLGDLVGVGPLLELLHDPGQLPGRRVGQGVGQRLRTCRLQLHVAGLILDEPGPPLRTGQVGLGELI